MGDSFSSGEGNPPFEYGTDDNGLNECHRSSQAYPRLLQNEPNLGLESAQFVGCSGATTNDVLGLSESDDPVGKWHDSSGPAQIDALSADTEVVTMTVGGNDVGFANFAFHCLLPIDIILVEGSCDEFTPIYANTVDRISNELPSRLHNVYREILDKAPNADIYIIGYPHIAPYKAVSDPFNQRCGGLYDAWPNTWGDARASHRIVNMLNDVIEDTVDAVNVQKSTNRLHYADVTSGSFLNHDACSVDSYFNGIDMFNIEYSVHPNREGQIAYKEDVAHAIG